MLSTECSGRLTGWPGGGVRDLPKDGPRAVSKCGASGLRLGVPDSSSGFTRVGFDSNSGGSVFARVLFRVSGAGSLVTISMRGSAPRAPNAIGAGTSISIGAFTASPRSKSGFITAGKRTRGRAPDNARSGCGELRCKLDHDGLTIFFGPPTFLGGGVSVSDRAHSRG